MPEGIYTVSFEKFEYETLTKEIEIYKNAMTRLNVQMKIYYILLGLLFFSVLVNGQNNYSKKIFNDFPIEKSYKEWKRYLSNKEKFVKCQSRKYKVLNTNSYGENVDMVIINISKKDKEIEQIIYFYNVEQVSNRYFEIKNELDKSYHNMGNYHYTGASYTMIRFGNWYKLNWPFNYPQIWVDLCLDKDVGLSIHSTYKKRRLITQGNKSYTQ